MAITLKQIEATPAERPALSGLSAAASALNLDALWQRIESYVAHRWTPRSIQWFIEGPGQWEPPLTPAHISTVEVWENDDWQSVTLNPSPFGGFELPACGPYRILAAVGASDVSGEDLAVPPAVIEAARRLAEYLAAAPAPNGVTRSEIDVDGFKTSHEIGRDAIARALQNSGAADLLRPYRKV